MNTTNLRREDMLEHELEHGRLLAKEGAEDMWNWSSPAGKRRASRRAELIVKAGQIGANDLVIEIGCGTGLFSRKVYDMTSARMTSIDLSQDLLNIAGDNLGSRVITFMKADAMNLPMANESFDVVFGSSILHHLDYDCALREVFRIMRKGGRMVFAEPNMLNPQIFIQKNVPFIKKMLGDSPDESAVVRWRLKKQMERLGFSDVHIMPYDFLHPATPEFMIKAVDSFGRFIEKIPVIREIAGSVVVFGRKP